jgi:D-alanine transaminase
VSAREAQELAGLFPSPAALANVNGVTMPLGEVRISALDRGFLFGDAVYEVLRVYRGRPWLVDEHFARLRRSLEEVRLGGVDLGRLRRRMAETVAAGHFQEATVYVQITRGAAPRSHAFPPDAVPLEFLFVQEFPDPYAEARRQGAAVITRPDIRWGRCDIKSTDLLGNVLALQAAKEAGCLEALFYLPDGTLTEGTHTNLFGVVDGALLTAPATHAILPGITRGLLTRLAHEAGVPVREQSLNRRDVDRVAEWFVSGTTSEVLPVVRVDGRPVGGGAPGPVTRRLQEAYGEAVRKFVEGAAK